MADVDFWFDFSSHYAYFAAEIIDERLHSISRNARWRPFLLGAAFALTKMGSLSKTPLRGDYARRDWARLAKIYDLPFCLPPHHPYRSQNVARIFYWLQEHKPSLAVPFARAAFRAHFAAGQDLTTSETALTLVSQTIGEQRGLEDWISTEAARQALQWATSEAIDQGVFGSPFFVADGEPFWGWDRIELMLAWLRYGEWGPQLVAPRHASAVERT
jgi:2-hydroxychromene-2-carboxylate isomerase